MKTCIRCSRIATYYGAPGRQCEKPTRMQDLLDFEFDHKYMMRGLIIDKKRGNVLKMDRHKYVKIAFHGFKKLSREERLATYALQRVS